MTKKKNYLLIGCGHHAKRIYVPLLEQLQNVETIVVVDLPEKVDVIETFLKTKKQNYKVLALSDNLNKLSFYFLDYYYSKYKFDGVIISTEPLQHKKYCVWALEHQIPILLDKPVTLHENVVYDIKKAKYISDDYYQLTRLYEKAKKINPKMVFSVMTQRRFHPIYKVVKSFVDDCVRKTNCPITSMQSYHCDGQFRLPDEILTEKYHGYVEGYGKVGHSGYHAIDIMSYFVSNSFVEEKKFDSLQVNSTLVTPNDFFEQVTNEDYSKIFGDKYSSKQSLFQNINKLGELDAYNNIVFKKGSKNMCVATINLLHNGFSQRSWLEPNVKDLYKGNGRVRHESHIIQQSAFQSIHIHSYQSKQVNENDNSDGVFEVGGEKHIEVFVFRNSGILGGEPFTKMDSKMFEVNILDGKSRGHQEDARALGFFEFIDAIEGKIKREDMISDFSTHRIGIEIMSAIYQSHIKNDKIKIDLKKNG